MEHISRILNRAKLYTKPGRILGRRINYTLHLASKILPSLVIWLRLFAAKFEGADLAMRWEKAVNTTSERLKEVALLLEPLGTGLLLEYIELLEQQRKDQETQIQDAKVLSADALASHVRQIQDIDKMLEMIQDVLRQKQQDEKRTPMDMVRPEFKGLKLGDIITKVLNKNPGLLTTNELTRLIYRTATDDEFDRARNSLSSELRSELKLQNPRWKKVGRNAYTAVELLTEVAV